MKSSMPHPRFWISGRRFAYFHIALWFAGLLAGISLAIGEWESAAAVLLPAFQNQPSPIFALLVMWVPIGILAISLRYSAMFLTYPLFFLFALCRGYAGMIVFMIVGSGAWLIRSMFLFSASCVSVLLWWLILRRNRTRTGLFNDAFFASVFISVVSVIDVFVISPFLCGLSKYF